MTIFLGEYDMAKLKTIEPVALFIGVIYNKNVSIFEIEKVLDEKFGNIVFSSNEMKFDYTDYYNSEMGDELFKKFFAFENLIKQNGLNLIKLSTNDIEDIFSLNSKRQINLDPGYLNLSKVVLASCKDFSHRIYIGKKIFAELTLSYVKGKYTFLPWTYPDYKSDEYLEFFYSMRKIYEFKLREWEKSV